MKKIIYQSFFLLLIFTVILGGFYPLLITGIGELFFPFQAEGSLIKLNDQVIGSELIGQKFDTVEYFDTRPSAIDYNPMPSGATNFGPTSDTLKRLTDFRRDEYIKRNFLPAGTHVPDDAVFASASGVDPEISIENANLQLNRIVKARNFEQNQRKQLEELINRLTEKPQFGILGETRINVLLLNIELDKIR